MANALGRKPESESRQYATKGLAVVKCGKEFARIEFVGKDRQGNDLLWDNGETTKKFRSEELPDTFVFEPNTEGEYYVCTSYDKTAVFAIGPWEGTFSAKVKDFSRPEKDADPAPFLQEGVDKRTKKPYSGLWFKVFWVVTDEDSEFDGVILPQKHVYQSETSGVEEDEDTGQARWRGQSDSPKAVWQPRLEKFLEAHDAVNKEINWPEDGNILPEILRRVKSAPVKVHRVKVEKGEVVGFADTKGKRHVEENIDEELEEAPKAKRSVKELKEELGYKEEKVVDEVDADFPKKPAKKAAKKVVEEDEEDL